MIIEQPAKWLRWLYPKATWRMDSSEKAVYLTFDDGPIPESTPFLLETLARYGVKATFFVVGENVRKYPELFRQIVERGHQIGNHTNHHLGSFKHWTVTYLIDTYECQLLIKGEASLSGEKSEGTMPLFRPPHGWMRHSIYYWLSKRYRIVMWDLVTRDYSKWLTADDVYDNVRRYARNGSIVTFHDSLKSIDKLRTALPRSIEWLQAEGYEFKTI
ncbi:MAG: polysaccharide deacetylase family protein [Prevotella sp.]|nr:polysaccharide deacetylase family protein [Prevotella sp.]MBR7086822.1 polysaccharide deacetylase family protein [Prevotella sp.]